MVYQFNAGMPPDSDFEPGDLRFLVPGNRGRWLDARRTPFRIVEVAVETGFFVIELLDFEDAGANWHVPLERVDRCQFAKDSVTASKAAVAEYQLIVDRLDQPLHIGVTESDRAATESRIGELRRCAREWLSSESSFLNAGRVLDFSARVGDDLLYSDLQDYMRQAELADIESAFATQFVRNAASGELVKGHRIVLAELGLAAFSGTVIRDPALFDGVWSRSRRALHIEHRLAFVRELFAQLGHTSVVLYRGLSCVGLPKPREDVGFMSTTFSADVAHSHFQHPDSSTTGVMIRQSVSVDRLFMTFFETQQMNERFNESEAVLVDDGRGLF